MIPITDYVKAKVQSRTDRFGNKVFRAVLHVSEPVEIVEVDGHPCKTGGRRYQKVVGLYRFTWEDASEDGRRYLADCVFANQLP